MIHGLAIAFLVAFVAAHVFDPHGDAITRPLSAFRDIPAAWVGYGLFALLIAIAVLVTRIARQTGDRRQFLVYFVVTIALTTIAVTPSASALHDLAVFVALVTLLGNYAWLLDQADKPYLLTAHLSIPLAFIALDAFSNGCVWQKALDLYFMTAVLIHTHTMQHPATIPTATPQPTVAEDSPSGRAPGGNTIDAPLQVAKNSC
jgi:hypothetical protein